MDSKLEYVYCIKNDAMPDICKCGGTSKTPETRCKEISNTSLPLKCQIAYYIKVTNWKKAEKFIHDKIVEKGIKRYKNREWFDCKPEFIKTIFEECKTLYGFVGDNIVEHIDDNENDKKDTKSDKTNSDNKIQNNNDNNKAEKIKIYNCLECNYTTEDSGNFAHHKTTKKHIKNIENNNKTNTINNQIEILTQENNELKRKLNEKDMQNQILEKELEILKLKINIFNKN